MRLTLRIINYFRDRGFEMRPLGPTESRMGRQIFVRTFGAELMVLYKLTASGSQQFVTHDQALKAKATRKARR